MRTRLIAAAGLLALAACGGGGGITGPAAVPSSAPASPQAVEARDGVTGATVAAGNMMATSGQSVTVAAAGYLTRVQLFRGEPVYLWPQDEAYVRQLVYGPAVGETLTRWSRGFTISAPGFEGIAAQVAVEASRATGLPISATAGGDVVVSIDPSDPSLGATANGYATMTLSGHTVTAGKIVFRSADRVNIERLLHEVGHTLGLSHTSAPDVMAPTAPLGATAYTDRERVALRMMYAYRAPGNVAPDREGAAGIAGGDRTVTVVD